MEELLNQEFWNDRWAKHQTGWDIGYPSTPIVEYFSKLEDKDLSILIPGCGNAHEAEFLVKQGFKDITLVDIAPIAVKRLREKFRNHPEIKVLHQDFFDFSGQFDLMIEQTFFCAISPDKREDYVKKAHQLLKDNGTLVGLMFGVDFEKAGPPFGGNRTQYNKLFKPYFEIKVMENCYNSIPPRAGNELFIYLRKK